MTFTNNQDRNQSDFSDTQTFSNDDEGGQFSREEEKENAIRIEMLAMKEQIAELQKQLARGTRDVTETAAKVTKTTPAEPETVAQKVETLLRIKPMGIAEVARTLHLAVGKITHEIKVARLAKKIYNVGQADDPRWTWRVGTDTSAKELQAAIIKLISETPLTFQQVCSATGARDSVVQGALVEIRRTKTVYNMGTQKKGRWFMLPETAVTARLDPKAAK